MKTLQIVGDSTFGGASYLVLEWSRFLLERDCQVHVLSTDRRTVRELRKIGGVQVVRDIPIPRDIAPLADLKAAMRLLRLFSHKRFDVVHTYTSTPGFLGRLMGRLAGVPVVLHHQAGWPVNQFSLAHERFLFTPLEYVAVSASTRSICVSHAVAQQAKQLHIAPQSKLVTICNGIDPAPFLDATEHDLGTKVRRELRVGSECLLLGNTGRLAAQKDNATLIRSIAVLNRMLPDKPFLLLLAGDGPQKAELESLAQSSGVADRVRFLGFYTNIPGLLAALDVFISPSLWEGLSISLLEAMATARPIVASGILPNAELIEHGLTGLLVPPRSPEQIAQAIARFVRQPDLAQACASAARQRVLEHYSIDRMFEQTWDLYVSLLREK